MPIVCIVPKQDVESFAISIQNRQWATEKTKASFIKKGDTILFIHGLHYCGEGRVPPGFPRLPSLDDVDIAVEEYWVAEVVSPPQQSSVQPLGEKYPMVFDLEFKQTHEDYIVKDPRLKEAIRAASTRRGLEIFQ